MLLGCKQRQALPKSPPASWKLAVLHAALPKGLIPKCGISEAPKCHLLFFPWLVFPFENKSSFKRLHFHQEKILNCFQLRKTENALKENPLFRLLGASAPGGRRGSGEGRAVSERLTPSKAFPSGKGSAWGCLENPGHRKYELLKNKQTNQTTKENYIIIQKESEWNHMCLLGEWSPGPVICALAKPFPP